MDASSYSVSPGSVAIVGMAGRFPSCSTPAALWELLRDGRSATQWFTDEELLAAGVPLSSLKDRNYVKAGMVLPDMEAFDAGFFGFGPREAAILDPQHRHFLESVWEALEDAGHPPERFDGSIGVFAGCGMQAYMAFNLLSNPELVRSVGLFLLRHTGNDKDFMPTRASYLLDLRGPSVCVQTACSTSLVAVHMAAQSLLSGECDMALAGGATIEVPHRQGYHYAEGEILSPDGLCKAFDDDAQGVVFGSGTGVVVLRRLEDAIADRDNIYAVIRGSAINNDGYQKAGYLAPSVDGQARAAAEALAIAGIDPETISYIEAHGTGTPVGDPIELAALAQAYGGSKRQASCGLGSIKTNIGHLDTAAGVASLIKVAMALRNETIPASLNFRRPNSRFDFRANKFEVVSAPRAWSRGANVRRAAVNSLGVGGTNAHVIIEEAPANRPTLDTNEWQLLALSAKTGASLEGLKRKWVDFLSNPPPGFSLKDAAFTTQVGRRAFAHRCTVAGRDVHDMQSALQAPHHARVAMGQSGASQPEVVFMFPGGGAQFPGMSREKYEHVPAFRAAFDDCFSVMPADAPKDLHALMLEGTATGEASRLAFERPTYAIPALVVAEYATGKMWEAWGVKPSAMIGHSAGEYAAACLAGVMSLPDMLTVAVLRGRLFESVPAGSMLTVNLPAEALESRLAGRLDVAAVNSPELSVASGPVGQITELQAELSRAGIECRKLHIDVAAHSRMLDAVLPEFRARLNQIALSRPRVRLVSNLAGASAALEPTNPEYWVRHLRETVRFRFGLEDILAKPNQFLLEVGPGQGLTALARLNAGQHEPLGIVASSSHAQDRDADVAVTLTAAGQLWTLGHSLDWAAIRNTPAGNRVSVPTYAFEKQLHWIDAHQPQPAAEPLQPTAPIEGNARVERLASVDDWFSSPQWVTSAMPARSPNGDRKQEKWLLFANETPLSGALESSLRKNHGDPIVVRSSPSLGLEKGALSIDPQVEAHYVELFRALDAAGAIPTHIVHAWSLDDAESGVALGFSSVVSMLRAIQNSGIEQPLRVGVVTFGSQSVAGEDASHPHRATLLGPVRVGAREVPNVVSQVLDLDPRIDATVNATTVIAELEAGFVSDLVVYRDGRRVVGKLSPLRLDSPNGIPQRLRPQGVYLITGGLGGIGLELAEYLASTVQARLGLLSRSPLPPRDQWPTVVQQEPTSRTGKLIQKLLSLEARGAQVRVFSGDVASEETVKRTVDAMTSEFGSISGVFHAAGTIDDGPIALKTPELIAAVFSPKLDGGRVLDRVFPVGSVDFFAVFSSTSVELGPPGQVDYVGANAFLDALAASRSDGLVMKWGIWSDIGLAAKSYGNASRDSKPRAPITHPLLGSLTERTESKLIFDAVYSPADMWVLSEHVVAGSPVLPGMAFVELARAAGEAIKRTPRPASRI